MANARKNLGDDHKGNPMLYRSITIFFFKEALVKK